MLDKPYHQHMDLIVFFGQESFIAQSKFPAQHDLLDLYNTISKVKFPEGSSCLQLKELSNTQEYLDLDADLKIKNSKTHWLKAGFH
ncbi:hypothetical protein [Acinetobacter defluvii]|uniref:hypothetical protein n=1 Tax=Acinetobacter defluvii TaxID=1871111 RepID=UPI003AF8972D